jgi:uncharacterized protein (DUF302 family)
MSEYGFSVEVPDGYDEAVLRTRLAIKAEGFSILTEMHVGGMLGPEAGTDRQYLIMGTYSSATSTKRIDPEIQVAVHLPCNFVVQEIPPVVMVAALDPEETVDPAQTTPQLVDEARAAVVRALNRVREPL